MMFWKKLFIIFLLFSTAFSISTLALSARTSPDLERNVDKLRVRVKVYYPKQRDFSHQTVICDPTTSDPTTFGTTGWYLPGNVGYRLNIASAPSSVRSNFQNIAASSFQTWSNASGDKVNFTLNGTTSNQRAKLDFVNTIVWGRTANSALAVTYTWYYSNTGQVADVDTVFNKRVAWAWTNPGTLDEESQCGSLNSFDVQNVLVHEIGHWMGLDDRYVGSEKDLTMYGSASPGELKKDGLATGDLLGIQTIYP